ncbi:WxL domain-containing protein [Vagococcus fessus]|uniref:WxL domain-containing protein n=1 Tax=Vagococcus fessus TaxID=120370 RepID=A0A430A7C0_9ENTE|nr:hypothetical protein [Vagococcus fessus]RSU02985.1 hypothetical protein CBF31_04465 [Vagococcus fessus]
MKKHKRLTSLVAVAVLGSQLATPVASAIDTTESTKQEKTQSDQEQPKIEKLKGTTDVTELLEKIEKKSEVSEVKEETKRTSVVENEEDDEVVKTTSEEQEESDTKETEKEEKTKETEEKKAKVAINRAGEVNVSNWGELKTALETKGTSIITLTDTFDSGGRRSTITANTGVPLTINGNGNVVTQVNADGRIVVEDVPEITLDNFAVKSKVKSTFITQSASSTLTDINVVGKKNIFDSSIRDSSILSIKGNLNFLNTEVAKMSAGPDGRSDNYAIRAGNIVIKNSELHFYMGSKILESPNIEMIESKITTQEEPSARDRNFAIHSSESFKLVNSEIALNTPNEFFMKANSFISQESKVEGEILQFYEAEPGKKSLFEIKDKSQIILQGKEVKNPVINFENGDPTINIKGKGTSLEIYGANTGNSTTNTGLIFIRGTKAQVNVTDYANVVIHTTYNTALGMRSDGGVFNLDNHATLDLASEDGTGTNSATLRFILEGANKFNIKNGSKMRITKAKGSGPAIRMFSDENDVSVSGGADFEIDVKGTGQGIQYPSGGKNGFYLKDEDSSVNINANKNSAIFFKGTGEVVADKGTFYTMRGNSANGGVQAKSLNFSMSGLKYFDFRNLGAGPAINAANGGVLKSNNSDFAIWKKGSDLSKSPTHSYENLDFEAKGADYNTLISPNSEFVKDVQADKAGMKAYSRMTANNQIGELTSLRVPTNADGYVYGRATVPEAKGEESRPAYENEINAVVELSNPDGTKQELEGTVINDEKNIYDDPFLGGVLEFKLPDGQEFLEEGQSIKFLRGRHGTGSKPKEIQVITDQQETVVDVTPPEKIKVDKVPDGKPEESLISAMAKSVKGALSEPGTVTLYGYDKDGTTPKGKPSKVETATEPDEDGFYPFEAPMVEGLEEDGYMIISGKNKDGRTPAKVVLPPKTNDQEGDEMPLDQDFKYHDRKFTPGTKVKLLGGELTMEVPDSLDFDKTQISTNDLVLTPNATGHLMVSDTRGRNRTSWDLKLSVEEGSFTTNGINLTDGFKYTTSQNKAIKLNNSPQIIEFGTIDSPEETIFSKEWKKGGQGFELTIPVSKQFKADYKGTFVWTLTEGPENREVD